eukprot:11958309-Karenia_brevis.AAC.1
MPKEKCVVVDLGGSKVQMAWSYLPCLTIARGYAHAFWDMQRARHLSTAQLFRLQGMDVEELGLNTSSISDSQMGSLLGN